MPIEIKMPALSPTMEAGNLTRWLKKEGDTVEPGDIIAEIETDKATMEVESIDEGILGKILIEEGSTDVAVNKVIAYLLEEGETTDDVHSSTEDETPSTLGAEKATSVSTDSNLPENQNNMQLEPSEPPSTSQPTVSFSTSRTPTSTIDHTNSHAPKLSSPIARKLAAEAGLNIDDIPGSGPKGRVIKHDVLAAMQANGSTTKSDDIINPSVVAASTTPMTGELKKKTAVTEKTTHAQKVVAPSSAPSASTPIAPSATANITATADAPANATLIKLDAMRATIAKRMVQSKQEVPHFRVTCDCVLDDLLAFRKQVNDGAPEGIRISVNDFIIKASALCLEALPETNVTWHADGIYQHEGADIAVAVALDGGLITPIIRNAQGKSLKIISKTMKELAKKARDRKLLPEDYTGGTFSISNLGMFGVSHFDAIINQPQGMILAVGAGHKQPIVTEDEELKIANVMSVTLACDHRMIDGVLAARWLQRFKRVIENPELMVL